MFGSRSRVKAETPITYPRECTEPNDAELVIAARANPRAFIPLYERYLGPVYRYCYVRLDSHEAAEDATSDVFLKALAGLPSLRGQTFAAWLFRIAHNVVVDIYRRRQPVQPLETAEGQSDPTQTPEADVEARVGREALYAALAQLPDEQRAAVELKLAGWSGEQIAAALGKSQAAVKMHRYRALDRLRTLFTQAEEGTREDHDE